MKLAMWSSYYHDIQPEDAVLELEKHGFRYSELSDEHSMLLLDRGDPYEVGKGFKAFADAHDVTFTQGHLKLSARLCEAEDRQILKDQLDLFRGVGVRYAVLHMDGLKRYGDLTVEELQKRNLEAIQDLIDHIKDTDIVICLENINQYGISATAEELIWFVEVLGEDHVAICLDTGHLNLAEEKDQVHFIRTAGKYLKALHLHDNDGSGDQHLMPFALGQVKFGDLMAALKEIGYDELYNLEVPGERYVPLELRGIRLDYMRNVLEYYDRNC